MARSKQAVAPSASPFAGGIDHVHEIKSRQEAAARACNAYGEGWAQIAETLVENYPYIETLRSDAIEMQRAAAVGGITLKRRTVAKPAHLILGIIYPEKVRQRISEWAAPLDIAHKHRWTGEQLKTALLATPLKKFKKTYDPASSKPTPEPAAINDNDESDSGGAVDDLSLDDALAVLTLPGVGTFRGDLLCYATGLGDGRVKITRWVRQFIEDAEFTEPAPTPRPTPMLPLLLPAPTAKPAPTVKPANDASDPENPDPTPPAPQGKKKRGRPPKAAAAQAAAPVPPPETASPSSAVVKSAGTAVAVNASADRVRAVMLDVAETVILLGLDGFRVDPSDGDVVMFETSDIMEKTAFLWCWAEIDTGFDRSFVMRDIKPLKLLFAMPAAKIEIDPRTPHYFTPSLVITAPGGQIRRFMLNDPGGIGTAKLNNPPKWTVAAVLPPMCERLATFIAEGKAFLKKDGRFGASITATEAGNTLAFVIDEGVISETLLFTTEHEMAVGAHLWSFETFLKIVKAAKSDPLHIQITEDTGLMHIGFKRSVAGVSVTYSIIIPGKLR